MIPLLDLVRSHGVAITPLIVPPPDLRRPPMPDKPLPPSGDWTDLGHDVRIVFTTRSESDQQVGVFIAHRKPDSSECLGSVTFDVPEAEGLSGPRWTVEQWEPLTISPSILCSCGHHGFIREGRWVPA